MIWKCPVCNENLIDRGSALSCHNSHNFDRSKWGSVNLLQSQKSKSKQRGDEKEMVIARRRFLERGHYQTFRHTLIKMAALKSDSFVLDIGVGEGYYALPFVEAGYNVYGIDISKEAIEFAAKRSRLFNLAVASSYALPLNDQSIDLAYVVFAPFSIDEVFRVLKKGGYFIEVFPLEKHLMAVKDFLYDKPYGNENAIKHYEGFSVVDVRDVETNFNLDSSEAIWDLFTMTPYYHRTPAIGKERLKQLDHLKVEAGFKMVKYQKMND